MGIKCIVLVKGVRRVFSTCYSRLGNKTRVSSRREKCLYIRGCEEQPDYLLQNLQAQSGHDEVEMCVVVLAGFVCCCCASQTG